MTAVNWDAEGNDEGNFWEVELKIAAENKLLKQNARIPIKATKKRALLAFELSSQVALKIPQAKIDSVLKCKNPHFAKQTFFDSDMSGDLILKKLISFYA